MMWFQVICGVTKCYLTRIGAKSGVALCFLQREGGRCGLESWPGCRGEEEADKSSRAESGVQGWTSQSLEENQTEKVSPLCLTWRGASEKKETFGPEDDFFGSRIRKIPAASGCVRPGRVKRLGVCQLHSAHREQSLTSLLFVRLLSMPLNRPDTNSLSHMSQWLYLRWLLQPSDGVSWDMLMMPGLIASAQWACCSSPRPAGQICMDLSHRSLQNHSARVSCWYKARQRKPMLKLSAYSYCGFSQM